MFGAEPGAAIDDPFFGGAGPARKACIGCGACMTGCRHNAKNTLVKNYLYLAEQAGAEVHPMTRVVDVRPDGDGYRVRTQRTGNPLRRRTFTAGQVVFAGNALNTQRLLHKLRLRSLPDLSAKIGELSRTNSEAVLSARSADKEADYTPGIAITSSFHPDHQTHIEPVRYGRGSGLLSLMNMALPDRPGPGGRFRAVLRGYRLLGVRGTVRLHDPRRWAEQSMIILVMQSLDNSITTYLKRGLFGHHMTSKQGTGDPNPSYIPVADSSAKDIAEKIGGYPGAAFGELAGVPLTAHFIGGCVIGSSAESGVIDPYQRVHGYEGLHVTDGSAITANLGVNPSLTIAAQAERAMALWPNNGDADSRPSMGDPYVRISVVPPARPAVPAGAPAALLLPVPAVPPR